MAKGLKTNGIAELVSFRKRVERQFSLDRIDRPDRDKLIHAVDWLHAYVVRMEERGDKEKPF